MATIDEIIAEKEEKHKNEIAQLKAKKEKIEARKLNAMIKGKRADDTRRKILAGALIIDMMEKDEAAKTRFMGHLDKFLTRNDDRELFGLSLKQKSTVVEPEPASTAKAEL